MSDDARHTSSGDVPISNDGPPAWFETVSSQVRYEGFSDIVVDTVRAPDGSTVEREIVLHDDAVAIVPVLPDGRILLLKQYRQPLRGHLLEIPAGKMDVAGESPEEVARRELAEETGHAADDLRWLTTFHNSAGWTTERTHVFLGTGLRQVDAPDGFVARAEEAAMELVPFLVDDLLDAVHAGQITDGKTVVGALLAAPHLRR